MPSTRDLHAGSTWIWFWADALHVHLACSDYAGYLSSSSWSSSDSKLAEGHPDKRVFCFVLEYTIKKKNLYIKKRRSTAVAQVCTKFPTLRSHMETQSITCEFKDDAVSWLFHAKGVAVMVIVCAIIDLCIRGVFAGVSSFSNENTENAENASSISSTGQHQIPLVRPPLLYQYSSYLCRCPRRVASAFAAALFDGITNGVLGSLAFVLRPSPLSFRWVR